MGNSEFRAVAKGYDPQFGARPLTRALQAPLLDPFAMKSFEGGFKPGKKLKVSGSNGKLWFVKQQQVGDVIRLGNGDRNLPVAKARVGRASQIKSGGKIKVGAESRELVS